MIFTDRKRDSVVTLSAAKGLGVQRARSFAALRMTGSFLFVNIHQVAHSQSHVKGQEGPSLLAYSLLGNGVSIGGLRGRAGR